MACDKECSPYLILVSKYRLGEVSKLSAWLTFAFYSTSLSNELVILQ